MRTFDDKSFPVLAPEVLVELQRWPGDPSLDLLSPASGIGFEDDQVKRLEGSRGTYSNVGIDLAAAHLERRGGKILRDEMRLRVFAGVPGCGGVSARFRPSGRK